MTLRLRFVITEENIQCTQSYYIVPKHQVLQEMTFKNGHGL